MLVINILKDEELQAACKKFISSLLPHKNFNGEYFTQALSVLTHYVRLEEYCMEYRAIIGVLSQMSSIATVRVGYTPRLVRETFDAQLNLSIDDMVINKEYRVEDFLKADGVQYNLEIPTVRADACSKLYIRCMELYDECFDMEVSTEHVFDYQLMLRVAFEKHAMIRAVEEQARLVNTGVWLGKLYFSGPSDWYRYTMTVSTEIKNRVEGMEEGMSIAFDTVEKEEYAIQRLKVMHEPISSYGIPPLDQSVTVLRHRFVVVAANENVGKTMFAKRLITRLISDNNKVLYICGETPPELAWENLLIGYIWERYKLQFTADEVISPDENLPVNMAKVVKMARAEFRSNSNLRFRKVIGYPTAYEDLKSEWELNRFDAIIIDHSLSLGGTVGTLKQNVDALAKAVKDFKNDYPVFMCVLSHLSADAKKQIEEGQVITKSPTRESQALSTEADELFVLYKNDNLFKAKLVGLIVYKYRGKSLEHNVFFLRTKFDVHTLEYNELDQKSTVSAGADAEAALQLLSGDSEFVE